MASNSPMQSSPRRILGDVTNSARNTPGKHNAVAKTMGKAAPIGSPLKQNQTMAAAQNLSSKDSKAQLPSGSPKKRQFEDIDDAEDDADADRRSPYRMMEIGSTSQRNFVRPPIVTIMPLPEESLSADEDEESPVHPREDSEDISDIEAVAEPICASFSSLINYDPTNTSDKSARASLEPKEPETAPTRAELLKLRLKIAMYKVKTDQTRIPFSNLVVPQKEKGMKVLPDPESEDEDEILLEIKPSQRRPAKAPANTTVTSGPVSKLLTPPVLRPTAFSTRFITAPTATSSPQSTSSMLLPEDAERPHDSPTKGHRKRLAEGGEELTSSAEKGRVASGLLDLMQAQ
ncbi:putative transporter [Venturia nashicola]|uniref:Putative transporter n=1 Tax=Venturia nashicola TaxID=86259 RepID=A0A4Z1P5R7_9PEZI|nr:putative transporter [Venturia nashicola]TLD36822.1 putative transporter [Venturia nashicola]